MTDPQTENTLNRLSPQVLQFATAQFALHDDLAHLAQVQRVHAPEAVILYCTRILEALAAEALRAVKLPASASVFSNLDVLQQYNLMPATTRYWAHALRRLGNLVRHVHRKVEAADAQWSVLFVERLLDWFFRRFRYGQRLPTLTHDGGPFALNPADELHALMEAIDVADPDRGGGGRLLLQQLRTGGCRGFFQTPALPGVLAEMLLDQLDRSKPDAVREAREFLEEALEKFAADLRLQQLMGLFSSRTGDLAQALHWLEPLAKQFPDDEETAGITAGVYKRYWIADKSKQEWLAKSQRMYRHVWERSKKTNAYLGINAATTALWLGRTDDARQVAAEVEALLVERATALANDRELVMNYWDTVTLAEAQLLLGNFTAARLTYREAFSKHAEQQANTLVAKTQLSEILRASGMSESGDAFLAAVGSA